MICLMFFAICFLASVAGAICGIGGGVIIKPVLDAFGILDVNVISFLSGCTVLSMTTYSAVKSRMSRESHVETAVGIPLALGAAAGGLAGKQLFSWVLSISPDKDQACCLLIVTVGTLIYTLRKERIRTCRVQNSASCALIGIFLGILSSFLGIGGGPINLVVLFYFFSMSTKAAAENSLYIIFFSQLASLASSIVTGSVPKFQTGVLLLMVSGGIAGGICGRACNKRMEERTVNRLFVGLMILMILINLYNMIQFMR